MSCRENPRTLKKFLKDSILNLFESSLVNHICSKLPLKGYTVLMYHGVVKDHIDCANDDWLQVKESEFIEQMVELKKNYHVVSFLDIINNVDLSYDKRHKIILTFDDGYANNYHVAYPILKDMGLPATIFLVTGVLGTKNIFWYDKLFTILKPVFPINKILDITQTFKSCHPHIVDEKVNDFLLSKDLPVECTDVVINTYRPLSMEEIYIMASSGLITFGSHTHQHELLTLMTNREVKETLKTSFEVLKTIPNHIDVFCYPNGFYLNPSHIDICREVGYKMAVSTMQGVWFKNKKDFEIPRWGIGQGFTLGKFSSIVSGSLYYLKRLIGGMKC